METNLDTSESEEYEDDLLKLEQGDILCSSTNDYIVQELLGSGSFGNVVKGVIRATNENVAIKILKDHPRVVKYAKAEVEILSQLNKENPDKFNVVKHYEYFQHNDNICLVFEMLDISLYDFIKKRNNRPLPVRHIRPIVQQVGNALDKLKSLQIIHTDLKPENIMLVNTSKYPFKIKVIDFGCAIHTSKVRVPSYIQTRYYRSPEIILALPFSEAIDMWSVGCIMAELFTGYPLYPGSSEYDQIRYITETQGLPPDNMLNLGAKTEDYFRNDSECEVLLWSLKSENHYEYETGISPVETRRYVFSSLDDMRKVLLPLKLVSSDTLVEMGDVWQFIDLLKEMLTMDPDKRITPIGLLSHPFITMAHLQHFARSSYVNHCFQAMEINKEQEVCPESESSNEEEKEKDYNERLLELQCAAEDVMVSPACGMGIIIHNSNYNVNTDREQEVWPDPPEMETESSNEEEKEKDYNGRLLELQCAAEDVMVSPACGMGIIIHNSNYNVNTDIEQVCFESPEMETESSNEEEKEKDYNGRLLELQCAAEDVMVSPARGMGIIIHNSNYDVNTDIEQVCFESPEMETESSNEEEKEKDYNGRLLELQCAAEDVMVSPACGMGIIIHNSNYNVNTDIEQVCFESPEMETELSNEEEKEKDYNGRLLELEVCPESESSNEEEKEKDYNERLLELQCAAEDVMVSPACGMGIIIHNSNYNVNTDIEQEVCHESPEIETESSNEEDKKEQLIEEDSGKKEKEKKNDRSERHLELHTYSIALAKQIASQTEAEPLGACESSPSAQIEIQDQHAQEGPLLEESSEAEESCEVVAEDMEPDTQERPPQCGKDTSDENEIEILSEFDEGDKVEEEKKKKKRGSRMRRLLRALCCCFHRKPKKLKVNTPETSDVIIYQVHGLCNSSRESSTESEAAASTHSSLPSERSAGMLRKWKCVNDLSKIGM
ncbi:uncharacterized protein LOC134600027 [Pelobates fuscus]|uniref:uncharacterized protein LOC134600027 n=1 Tax=Pelobates fuscus TaxID=191477 RepID=UPI002FE49C78